MRSLCTCVTLLLLAACGPGRLGALQPAGFSQGVDHVSPSAGARDAGPESRSTRVDGGVGLCNETTAPECCVGTTRVGSATCGDQGYVCAQGALCDCFGHPQDTLCSDFCGSDILQPPTCFAEGWGCGPGLVRTSSCAPDTCWGEPGDGCLNERCEAGHWVCDNADAGAP